MPKFMTHIISKLKELTPIQKIALGVTASMLISVAMVSLLWIRSPEYGLLYSNLTPDDAAQIIKRLKETRVPYRLKESGKIYVPLEDVYELRIRLASEGLPKGGSIGFEIFDKNSFGISDFVQRINYIRALQGELARTIESLEEVEWARVHIAMPKESLFISKQKQPSASVVLKLKPNRILTEDQIQGIAYLVASAVPRLSSERVVIVDSEGHILAGVKKDELFSGNQIKIKNQIEQELEDKIISLLEKVTGKDKVIAKVSVDMDFSKIEKTLETYDPYNVAIRSEQIIQRQSSGTQVLPMGVPGVLSNLPDTNVSNAKNVNLPKGNQKETNRVVNYEIGKTVQSIKEPIGRIVRISAAVLVDGKYSAADITKLKLLVQKAIGYSKQRGDQIEIVNMPFKQIETKSHKKGIIEILGSASLISKVISPLIKGIIATAIVFILVAGLKKIIKELPLQPSPPEETKELPRPTEKIELPELAKVEEVKALPVHEEVKRIARKDPEKVAYLTKLWLKEAKGEGS